MKNYGDKGSREFSHDPGVKREQTRPTERKEGSFRVVAPLRHGPVITWSKKRVSAVCVGTLLHKLIRHPPETLLLTRSQRSRNLSVAADGNLYGASMGPNAAMRRSDHRPCHRTITARLIILPVSFHCSSRHCYEDGKFEEIGRGYMTIQTGWTVR